MTIGENSRGLTPDEQYIFDQGVAHGRNSNEALLIKALNALGAQIETFTPPKPSVPSKDVLGILKALTELLK